MANIAELKSSLHQQVANTEDEKILLKLQLYYNSLTKGNKKIVAYNYKGKGLTAKEYKAELADSIVQYKLGKVVSQKTMEKGL
jgi:hypothetical protein